MTSTSLNSPKENFVFICYARKDNKFREEIKNYCEPIDEIGIWADVNDIQVGDAWEDSIDQAIEACKIAIVLVSINFFTSQYIKTKEFPKLIAAHKARKITIIPIFVSKCIYQKSPIKDIQAINLPSKPLKKLAPSQREDIYEELANLIVHHFEKNISGGK